VIRARIFIHLSGEKLRFMKLRSTIVDDGDRPDHHTTSDMNLSLVPPPLVKIHPCAKSGMPDLVTGTIRVAPAARQ
jgi:hypothetical protein